MNPPSGRTWLDAVTAIPDRRFRPVREALATPPRPDAPRVRVYRIPHNPDDPELRPSWAWRCNNCDQSGNGCLHQVLHQPGSWPAAFCAGFQHIHRRHPQPQGPGHTEHTVRFGGRRRCDWSTPTASERTFAVNLLGYDPTGHPDQYRDFAREVLALAGLRAPGGPPVPPHTEDHDPRA